MNQQPMNSNSPVDCSAGTQETHSPRCQHRTRTGRRCRHSVSDAATGLCSRHLLSRPKHPHEADLTAVLTGQLTNFVSAADINEVLSRLLIVLTQDRISARRAAVIAYISNLLLRTLPAIDRDLDEDRIAIPDPPSPVRDPQPEVQPA